MKKQKFNLVLDLSWSSKNNSIYALQEVFEISYYRFIDNIHNVRTKEETDKLCEFLTNNNIKFKKDSAVYDDEFWINFELKSEIFLDVLHHIELRTKD